MDVRVIKATVRTLVALFAAFFGTLQLSMTVCRLEPGASWTHSLCHTHSIASPLLSFACLFALTLLVLSRRSAAFRRPLAVLFLLAYAIYGLVEAFEYQLWWLALVPVAALAAAIGVALRARWGTLATYAISALFVIYWLWGVITAALGGVFQSRPPLEAALMLVPGIAFGLLAGFCCYACRPRAAQSA
jgi:hypothetical protein